ncbi:hypothetical protein [Effusibacillus consociatus]|uniref:Uncharacterized protein n=1 Tax=Effusibacillus consociatus TaxID=1117041 RepID=A0ABV9Q598_9BACL
MKLILRCLNVFFLLAGFGFVLKGIRLYTLDIDGTGVGIHLGPIEINDGVSKEEVPFYAVRFVWVGILLLVIPLISLIVRKVNHKKITL